MEKYLEGREDDTHKEMRVWLEELLCRHEHDVAPQASAPYSCAGVSVGAGAEARPNSCQSPVSARSASCSTTMTISPVPVPNPTAGLNSVRVFDPLNARTDMRPLVSRFLEKEADHRLQRQRAEQQASSAAADPDADDDEDIPASYSSPVCYAHEFPEYFGLPASPKSSRPAAGSCGANQNQPTPMETESAATSCCKRPVVDVEYHSREVCARGSRGWLERLAAHVPEEDAWHLHSEALVDRYLTVFVRSSSFLNKMVH